MCFDSNNGKFVTLDICEAVAGLSMLGLLSSCYPLDESSRMLMCCYLLSTCHFFFSVDFCAYL